VPTFNFTFSHNDGYGEGTVEAKSPLGAKRAAANQIKAGESDTYKIKNLEIEVGDEVKDAPEKES